MKWKNRDINVVVLANIPKFSKLDDIGTPLTLFDLFFDEQWLIWLLAAPSCTVIERKLERKQTLVFKLLMRYFAYSWAYYGLVADISFQTVECIRRTSPKLLYMPYLILFHLMHLRVFWIIYIFVATNNLINKTNSQTSVPWLLI